MASSLRCESEYGRKLALAQQLARLGVDVIEAGFRLLFRDFKAVQRIAREIKG